MSSARLSQDLRSRLERAEPVVALTGAGVSAESGLATFRGPGGHWEGRDPVTLATPEAFRLDPLTVWRFYEWRRRSAAGANPNAGHLALARLEQGRGRFDLITQNVDGLHERAGSRNVVNLHGSLWRLRCVEEGREFEDLREDLGELPPRCECGSLLRPGVVWFGEPLPTNALAHAEKLARAASVVIVAGTSSLVYPAAALPGIARSSGAYVVEVNPQETALSAEADECLRGTAAELLPLIADAASARTSAT